MSDFTKAELNTIEYCVQTLVLEQENKVRTCSPFDMTKEERQWYVNSLKSNKELLEKVRKM